MPELPAPRRRCRAVESGVGKGVALRRGRARWSATTAIALVAACAHKSAPPPPVSAFAPALQLTSVGSVPYAQLERGQVLLVTFLATWCFPCLGQLPILEKAQREHASRGFRIVAVGMDLEGAEVLEPFAREYQLPFPLLVADDRIRKGETAFGLISSLPASFLFGRDGRLVAAFAGFAAAAELDPLIASALEQSLPR